MTNLPRAGSIAGLRSQIAAVRADVRLSRRIRDNLVAYVFVSPWLTALLVFFAYPILASFYFAFTRYNVLSEPIWVGLNNFVTIFFKDPLYWKSVGNTLYFAFLSVPLTLAVSLFLAVLLNQKLAGIGLYRTIYYLPSLVPAVATTFIWRLILEPRWGLLNVGLDSVGLPTLGWLESAAWSKPALIIMSIWMGCGGPMVVFLAGLKDIPQSLLEAAEIDGANAAQRFRHVTLPLLTPTIFFNLIIGLISGLQVFASAFVAASAQNAAGTSTAGPLSSLLMYMIHLYRYGFRYFDMGIASAMAVVMFAVLAVITYALVRTSNLWVYYEGQSRD
jgi:multiple sugar transport system permease protein